MLNYLRTLDDIEILKLYFAIRRIKKLETAITQIELVLQEREEKNAR